MIAAPSIWALVWNVISWVMWIQLIIWRSALLDRTPDSFALSNRNLWDFIGPWDVLMLKPSFSSSREKSKKGKSASFLLRAFLSPKNQVDHTESRESFQLEKRTNYTQRQTDRETFHCVTSGELITWTKDQVLRKKRSATHSFLSVSKSSNLIGWNICTRLFHFLCLSATEVDNTKKI